MNREIRFSVWDKKSNRYYRTVDFLSWVQGGIRFMWHDRETDEMMVTDLVDGDYELLQFTGLRDKRNQWIYEGDIVRELAGLAIVVYEGYSFRAKNINDGNLRFYFNYPDRFEVIGNIFENPELTNTQKEK